MVMKKKKFLFTLITTITFLLFYFVAGLNCENESGSSLPGNKIPTPPKKEFRHQQNNLTDFENYHNESKSKKRFNSNLFFKKGKIILPGKYTEFFREITNISVNGQNGG